MNTGLNDEEMQASLEQLAEQRSHNLRLKHGGHKTSEDGLCLMEAVAFFAGESHSADPQCASPLLATYGQRLNDRLSDEDRQLLVPLIPRLIGTRSTPAHDLRRAYLMIDLTIREIVPKGLQAVGWTDLADQLRAIGPVVDTASARAAVRAIGPVVDTASARAAVEVGRAVGEGTFMRSAAAAATYAAYAASYAASAVFAASAAASYAAEYAVSASAASAVSAASAASYATASAASAAFYVADDAARRAIVEATVRAYEHCILLAEKAR